MLDVVAFALYRARLKLRFLFRNERRVNLIPGCTHNSSFGQAYPEVCVALRQSVADAQPLSVLKI